MRVILSEDKKDLIVNSNRTNPREYFSNMANYAEKFKKGSKNVVFLG